MNRRVLLSLLVVAVTALAAILFIVFKDDNDAADRSAKPIDYAPKINPADFTTTIDNPFFPLTVGTRWVYQGHSADGVERTEVEVTPETRTVMGVKVVVVRDTESINGQTVEEAFDWYAQDNKGNVWYFGTETTEYENGKAVEEESWVAGKDDAQPGIIMKAQPRVGDTYRQEYAPGVEEDLAEVLSLDAQVSVPYGPLTEVLEIKDTDPLEPDVTGHRFYASGVGVVLETVEGDAERVELVEMIKP